MAILVGLHGLCGRCGHTNANSRRHRALRILHKALFLKRRNFVGADADVSEVARSGTATRSVVDVFSQFESFRTADVGRPLYGTTPGTYVVENQPVRIDCFSMSRSSGHGDGTREEGVQELPRYEGRGTSQQWCSPTSMCTCRSHMLASLSRTSA